MQGMTVNQLKKVFRSGKTFYRVIFNQIEVIQLQGKKVLINRYGVTTKTMGARKAAHRWRGEEYIRDLQGHNGAWQGCACFDTVRKAERFVEYCIANNIKKNVREWDHFHDHDYNYNYDL